MAGLTEADMDRYKTGDGSCASENLGRGGT